MIPSRLRIVAYPIFDYIIYRASFFPIYEVSGLCLKFEKIYINPLWVQLI